MNYEFLPPKTGPGIACLGTQNIDADVHFDLLARNRTSSQYHQNHITASEWTNQKKQASHAANTELRTELEQPDSQLKIQWTGYFRVPLDKPWLREPEVLWTMGKGFDHTDVPHRGVDLLVAHPEKPADDVAPVHAVLRLHPRSGILMIAGASDEHITEYETSDDTTNLGKDESHVFPSIVNGFPIGSLEFDFIFGNKNNENDSKLVALRNHPLERSGHEPP